ncbi:adhesion G-protein coupled receptor G2, partial [Hippocampus zosterae]|uniref:adhesion G-protein coupled receptor G2 n=1 Tax=Hippocampus zosterae TaxID=109293 RepID=UPI00223E5ADA
RKPANKNNHHGRHQSRSSRTNADLTVIRVKKPSSQIPKVIHLLLLFTGLPSWTEPSTTPPHVTSEHYLVEIAIKVTGPAKNESEIASWLQDVLQNNLGSCVLSHTETTALPPPFQTTSANSSAGTPSTTTNETHGTITTAATFSNTLQSNTTSAATSILEKDTTVATTTLQNNPTAETTPAAATTPSDTTGATTSDAGSNTTRTIRTKRAEKPPNSNNTHFIQKNLLRNSGGLFQGVEVSCAKKTEIRKTNCSAVLTLRQKVSPCCILQTICTANPTSSDIRAVPKRTNLLSPLNDTCSSDHLDEKSCVYTPNASNSKCEDSAFAAPPCATVTPNVTTAQPNTASGNTTSSPHVSTVSPNDTESQANALLELSANVSRLNSSQVDQLVSQLEDLLAGPEISLALANTTVHIVSNLLDASEETLASSYSRIISMVDTVGLKLVLEAETETLSSPSLALSVKAVDASHFQQVIFSISDPSNAEVRADPRFPRNVRNNSSIPQGSITLPASLTQNLTSEEQQMASRVHFNFYQKSSAFQDASLGKRRLNSGILGASLANLTVTGLREPVVITLKNVEPIPANYVATCVFWDFALNERSGGWNTNGCYVHNSTDEVTVCGCDHLTSFSILLDLAREPLTSRVNATILTFITYIGCGISAVFLALTLLTYLAFGKLRKDIPSKILIQLCVALLLLNLVFLVDAWLALYPDAVGLCISTAWFLHYFLLAAFTWMGLEGVHMYLALVKVFNMHVPRYIVWFSLAGWGAPVIVVIIVIAVDKDNYGLVSYGRFSDGTSDDFCWLKNDIAFYVAVVAYFCVVFLFNLIVLVVVLVQLQKIKRQNPHNSKHRSAGQDVRSVVGVTILLGLTWGCAFFAWGPVNLPFMYLFAICNSLQGFFIFVFHCAVKDVVRRHWRAYLCFGKMRPAENLEWSRTATQMVKRASVSGPPSNNSSAFLRHNLEQTHGIGNPLEDRIITADEEPSAEVVLDDREQRSHQMPPRTYSYNT